MNCNKLLHVNLMEVEIYVEESSLDDVLVWAESYFSAFSLKLTEKDMFIYEGVYQGIPIPITVQEVPDNPPCIGVWFNAESTPWGSNIECARDAYKSLGGSILCDPGDEYPLPDQFLRISAKGERIVRV